MVLAVSEEYLQLCRERVAYYTPLVEKRTNTCLQELEVAALSEFSSYFVKPFKRDFRTELQQTAQDRVYNGQGYPYFWVSAFFPIGDRVFDAFAFMLFSITFNFTGFRKIRSLYEDRTLFVNTKKRRIRGVLKDEIGVDRIAMNGLGHLLWTELGGEDPFGKCAAEEAREIEPGFAAYCERVAFSDLYPAKGNFDGDWFSDLEEQGFAKIGQMVKKYGLDILLRVPREWKSLEPGDSF